VPELLPFPKQLAMEWASQSQTDTGASDEQQVASIRELLNAQLFELRYRTLDRAVAQLESLIRTSEERW
jgi:negative regulator of replication initiation